MKKILIVCEKPMQAKTITRALSTNNKNIEYEFTSFIAPGINSYKFEIPSTLYFKDIPYINNKVLYKKTYKNYDHSSIYTYNPNQETVEINENLILSHFYEQSLVNENISNEKIEEWLNGFDEIIYGCDSDYTGARAFDFHMEKYFKISNIFEFANHKNIKLSYLHLLGIDDASLIKAFDKRISLKDNPNYLKFKSSYMKKDYFDYHYKINELMLFGDILSHLNINNFSLTNFMIQTLYLMDKIKIKDAGEIVHAMQKAHIGSAASRSEILNILNANGLLIKKNITINESYGLSNDGKMFLSYLHPSFNDSKLTQKLDNDIENSDITFEEFKEKYQLYLKKLFGKQKRFFRKKLNE
jgi:hypothetical protein